MPNRYETDLIAVGSAITKAKLYGIKASVTNSGMFAMTMGDKCFWTMITHADLISYVSQYTLNDAIKWLSA